MYFTVLLLLEGPEVERPLAFSLSNPLLTSPAMKIACGVQVGPSNAALQPYWLL